MSKQVKVSRTAALEGVQRAKGAYFDLVKDAENWKGPIDAIVEVPAGMQAQDLAEAIQDAVMFFTGSVAQFRPTGDDANVLHVVARGYYAAVGA